MFSISKNNFPIHEKFETGLLMAVIGGFLDAYTYICYDGIFANAQTGNIVLLSISLIHHNADDIVSYLIPILFFSIGVFITEFFAARLIRTFFIVSLVIQLLMLSFIGFFPNLLPPFFNTAIISMDCSIQLSSFKKMAGIPYVSTMCTGNLRASMEALYGYFRTKDRTLFFRFLHFGSIIIFFALGAILGATSSTHFGNSAIFICCGLCLILLLVILTDFFVYRSKPN